MSSWSKAIVTAIYLRYRQQWVLFYYSSQNRVSYQLSVIRVQFTDYCLLFTENTSHFPISLKFQRL
ncbi:hypothetical protein FXO09_16720 [Microcystis aeruginosa KLA2]|nr:MAG: hypothetical protein EWV62_00530 [Microcystis aeruginosa Ma_OC_LR_19540900_S633]TYT70150.1 hypothetical protein FXO09_16720 [Microcystis aeruginosa KLA2]